MLGITLKSFKRRCFEALDINFAVDYVITNIHAYFLYNLHNYVCIYVHIHVFDRRTCTYIRMYIYHNIYIYTYLYTW